LQSYLRHLSHLHDRLEHFLSHLVLHSVVDLLDLTSELLPTHTLGVVRARIHDLDRARACFFSASLLALCLLLVHRLLLRGCDILRLLIEGD